jgi:hypothetical protein
MSNFKKSVCIPYEKNRCNWHHLFLSLPILVEYVMPGTNDAGYLVTMKEQA